MSVHIVIINFHRLQSGKMERVSHRLISGKEPQETL